MRRKEWGAEKSARAEKAAGNQGVVPAQPALNVGLKVLTMCTRPSQVAWPLAITRMPAPSGVSQVLRQPM